MSDQRAPRARRTKREAREAKEAAQVLAWAYLALHAADFVMDKNSAALVSLFLTGDDLTKHVVGMYLEQRWKRIDQALLDAGRAQAAQSGGKDGNGDTTAQDSDEQSGSVSSSAAGTKK